MPSADDPPTLIIELKNIRQLELIEMAHCLLSAGAEYGNYLSEHESAAAAEDVRLFVREVRQGSAIFALVAACWNVFPELIQRGTSLLGFLRDLRKTFAFLKHESTDRPTLDKRKLERIERIVQPTAKDSPGAQINMIYVEKGAAVENITLGMPDANVIQNSVRSELARLDEPATGIHEGVLMYLYQARNDASSDVGDKAVIERFTNYPVKTKFATAEAKARLIATNENIFRQAYVVDVRVDTVRGRPMLYTVLRVQDSFPLPQQQEASFFDSGDPPPALPAE